MINIILTQQIKSTTYPLFSDALMKYLTHTSGSPETAGTSSTSATPGDAAPHPAATSAEPGSASAPVPSTSVQPSDVKAPPIDPADWPSVLSNMVTTEIVLRGPYQVKNTFSFPKQKDGRSCQHDYFNRVLVNGKKSKEAG